MIWESYWKARNELISRFTAVSGLNTSSSEARERLLTEMRSSGNPLTSANYSSTPHMHCVNILDAALEQRRALRKLGDVVRLFFASDAAGKFRELVYELLPSEFFDLEERFEFLEFIKASIPASEYVTYYRAATIEISYTEPEREPTTADELVRALESFMPQLGSHPLVLLTEAIAQRATAQEVARRARDWSDRAARNIDDTNPEQFGGDERSKLAVIRQNKISVLPADSGRATLTLMLEPWGNGKDQHGQDQYLFSASLYPVGQRDGIPLSAQDTPVTLNGARAHILDALRRALRLLYADSSRKPYKAPKLEFILPRHLLDHPIEQLPIRPFGHARLENSFVVVVRDIERQEDPILGSVSREKWQHMMAHNAGGATALSTWFTCQDPPCDPGELNQRLAPAAIGSLGLTFTPVWGTGGFDMTEALDVGTPVMVWPRWPVRHGNGAADCAHGTCPGMRFKTDLSGRLTDRRITDLPEIILEMRQMPSTADSPLGLTLLWDDPGHEIKPADHHLGPPGSTEDS